MLRNRKTQRKEREREIREGRKIEVASSFRQRSNKIKTWHQFHHHHLPHHRDLDRTLIPSTHTLRCSPNQPRDPPLPRPFHRRTRELLGRRVAAAGGDEDAAAGIAAGAADEGGDDGSFEEDVTGEIVGVGTGWRFEEGRKEEGRVGRRRKTREDRSGEVGIAKKDEGCCTCWRWGNCRREKQSRWKGRWSRVEAERGVGCCGREMG